MSQAVITAQKAIESRKKQDAKFRDMDVVIKETSKILQYANFENHTLSKIERKQKQNMYEDLKGEMDMILHERKQELADLYNFEMEDWKRMVLGKVETQEDRKQRIKERAYALKEARETKRQEFVQSCYNKQWRDACDDARTLDSKQMTVFMQRERLNQIDEKRRKNQNLNADENTFLENWRKQLEIIEERDRKKWESRHNADMENFEGLKKQMEDNWRTKQEHYQRTQAEDDEEIRQIRALIQEEEDKQHRRREEETKRGREVYAFNEQYKDIIEEEKRAEKQQDAILLDYALRKEREQLTAEEMKRQASKEAAKHFRKYLEEQMQKEAEDTAFVDEVRRREEERVWKARDDALKAREDARNYLMQQVDQGRQQQIRAREQREMFDKQEGKVFADKFLQDASEGVAREKAEIERRRQIAMENNIRLRQQIDNRGQQKEAEKQEVYLEDKHMKYMEKLHQQKLAEQGGSLRLHRPLQKNNWYS